jgi:hypothetical protein
MFSCCRLSIYLSICLSVLATLYTVRIQTRRSLDRRNYTHTGEFIGSPTHATIAFCFVYVEYQQSFLIQNVV